MGVCEEDGAKEHESMMCKEQYANPEHITRKKLGSPFKKNKAESLLIAGLILVIIGLTVTLIVVRTRSRSYDLNNEEKKHETIISLPEITEIRNQKSAPCEDDWIWYQGKCYYFSTERDTWKNGEKFCNSHNSSLAIIENKEELDFLFLCNGLDNHWIGIRRTDDNTAWTWTDGSLYDESFFKIKRTSDKYMECAYLNSGKVESDKGNFNYKWICNKK